MELSEVRDVVAAECIQRGWTLMPGVPEGLVMAPGVAYFWVVMPVSGGLEGHSLFTLSLPYLAYAEPVAVRDLFRRSAANSAYADQDQNRRN